MDWLVKEVEFDIGEFEGLVAMGNGVLAGWAIRGRRNQ